jgi:hypothetical protein
VKKLTTIYFNDIVKEICEKIIKQAYPYAKLSNFVQRNLIENLLRHKDEFKDKFSNINEYNKIIIKLEEILND